MSDLIVRIDGVAGRITLNRPKALNALTWDLVLGIEAALDAWRDDDAVQIIVIDAVGDKAFCSGGDIAEMYATGKAGDFTYGQRFWRDEYRLNRKIFHYAKPVVSFLHGFTMGGGVGVGCHGSHRIVGETSQIAMPEVTIGLVPDVGGSLILATAPGHIGEYLGLTGTRMDATDAIYAGFADAYVPEDQWDVLKVQLCETGDVAKIADIAQGLPSGALQKTQAVIDGVFGQDDVFSSASSSSDDVILAATKKMQRNAPLALQVTLRMIRAVRDAPTIETALDHEFRYTFRSAQYGDFIEGIRAAIIDRDRAPVWQHSNVTSVPAADTARMTAPLGDNALIWED
ncbi:enoyl-CoA hydratase/isomerase family protein [Loktanella sp. F6476L]|uniref:enoyl-CoA hydratase/isomerase family protein n=1 Tax=Loktanella sp. F6476L TaxID=2926405 RepID=UPI001FF58FB5|nr:enoyl-CoA hydratase/isomerase family protein [Loktanella sp. F6476L]MCK0119681.1 enoyl-CoA hydratase/isomerase family protein [Loktanella sp. F6476L]